MNAHVIPAPAGTTPNTTEDATMIPELGHFALILALTLALVQGVLPLAGAARGVPRWMAVARPAATGQFVFVAFVKKMVGKK